MNEVKTWKQGYFVNSKQYQRWTDKQKHDADEYEKLLVRPAPTENAICQCNNPDDAKWIAGRLNLASELEQLTYDFALGKSDGSELRELVLKKCDYI